MDARTPRDGRVIEELGYYDPMVPETDARAILRKDRIAYWLSVGAQPTPKVKVLIKKYAIPGTHLAQQKEALERLEAERKRRRPPAAPRPAKAESPAEDAAAEGGEAAPEEAVATEAAPAGQAESDAVQNDA